MGTIPVSMVWFIFWSGRAGRGRTLPQYCVVHPPEDWAADGDNCVLPSSPPYRVDQPLEDWARIRYGVEPFGVTTWRTFTG